ncbi:Short-chain dehydrogenase/reductase bet4 [Pseudocercospora fuligena]|uniref:Short-chain dehydrogenase/reductase bet4 n=1 Tax=Pseudocercospora fuligena TaxID=685502 RepID=A0A8H6RBD3_9PEZI|nr:Short-chain dehydrogenase/reductase bet4 [Pseudocercospora fuligena]KAF7189481.1 Short-chain dehydrogenase/reductase bet4 [Pseudocercospora fuligena]
MFEVLSYFLRQSFFLGRPPLTEQNLPDQSGRIVIITGGYAGVGKELARVLYQRNATIYLAGRSAEKATKAIEDIKRAIKSSNGQLHFLHVDLADLTTIKPAVDKFMKEESTLHVLVNNAGTMFPPVGSMSVQGQEVQIATNCTGHFLFTKLLTPILEKTAAKSKRSTVRVLWAASSGVDLLSPKTGGMTLDKSGNFLAHESNNQVNYGMSKVGNYFLASEYAKHHPLRGEGKGVLSIAFNPGHLKTELQRHSSMTPVTRILVEWMLYPAIYGAYTELWAGWSADVNPANNAAYVWPWGKFGRVRSDIEAELKHGGKAEKFWEWCERETEHFA